MVIANAKHRALIARRFLPWLAVALAGCLAIKWWLFPFGHRACVLPCLMAGLMNYASEHGGRFPDGCASARDCLRLLVPKYVPAEILAGLSGDRLRLFQELHAGHNISEEASSLVYWPGFRWDNDPHLAIVWDRTPGVNGSGRRSWPGSHAVGYADGRIAQIPASRWRDFLVEQEKLRARLRVGGNNRGPEQGASRVLATGRELSRAP
ncbi:MAG: hypothetical protein KatS3mg132_681 [Limisphaera sp.]|nr:MAG: hypothetical protein KatS3mg132_681 [Limisphaera sp.]